MRKRNRQRKTYHFKPVHIGSALLFVMLLLPWVYPVFVDLNNEQTATSIKNLEYQKRSLQDSLRRQTADWNQLIQPANLEEAARQNGLNLAYAPPERSVIVRQDGRLEIPAALHAELAAARSGSATSSRERKVASTGTSKQQTPRRRR